MSARAFGGVGSGAARDVAVHHATAAIAAAAIADADGVSVLVKMLKGDSACTVEEIHDDVHHCVLRVLRGVVCHAHFELSIKD